MITTKDNIIFDWLSIKSNRLKLPVYKLSKENFKFLEAIADIHIFEDETVYIFNNNISLVIIEE